MPMSIKEHLGAYHVSLQDMLTAYVKKNEHYFRYPAKYNVKPFRIIGDLYYVGDARVCVHLLDTHDGLILFDSGFHHTIHLLVQAIWEAGFDPKDIRYIIHSHGHYDHFGATNDFKELYGCKTFLSAVDAELLRENPARSLMEYQGRRPVALRTPQSEDCLYLPRRTYGTSVPAIFGNRPPGQGIEPYLGGHHNPKASVRC